MGSGWSWSRKAGSEDDHAAAAYEGWLEIKRRMRKIRALGYAASVDDPDPGILVIAVPLKQQGGGIAGSLCLALSAAGENAALIETAGPRLIDAATDMAQRMLAFATS